MEYDFKIYAFKKYILFKYNDSEVRPVKQKLHNYNHNNNIKSIYYFTPDYNIIVDNWLYLSCHKLIFMIYKH